MKKILLLVLFLPLVGCRSVNKEMATEIRDQHAIFYSYVKRIDDKDKDNDPSPAQHEQMIRAALVTLEAMDRQINNWVPSSIISESNLEKPKD